MSCSHGCMQPAQARETGEPGIIIRKSPALSGLTLHARELSINKALESI